MENCEHKNRHTDHNPTINLLSDGKFQTFIISYCADCGLKLKEVEVIDSKEDGKD